MNCKLTIISLLVCGVIHAQSFQQADIPAIIKKLSLDDKVNLVLGTGMDLPGFTTSLLKIKEKVPGAAGNSYPIESASIPTIIFSDGPAGVRIEPKRASDPNRTFYATAFPVATLMSSTWDTQLMQDVGKAFGEECKDYGVDILLAPALNIQRSPLGGRNFEYYSEDPLLSGKMASAFVKGVQSEGIGTSIKHFAANNQETNRMKVDVVVSERALREIYLKGFEIAVKEANPWTVMSSYNKVNGAYTSQSHDLLTTILRDEWKFKGFVMSDWFAGDDAVAQMKAGNDLIMPGIPEQREAILKALKDGTLSEEIINKNVERILNVYVNTLCFKGYKYNNAPNLEQHKTVSRTAATQGMVLLKNDKKVLPLNKPSKIALLGNASIETTCGGTGSGDVNRAYSIPIYEGLKNAGFKLDEGWVSAGVQYIAEEKKKVPPKKFFFEPDVIVPEKVWSENELASLAKANDIAVYVLGRTSGEMNDRTIENDFNLSDSEQQDIRNLSKAFHKEGKKLVVLLNIGGVIETSSWKDLTDAILVVWQPGQEAGNAVAEVLSGKVNPSGKLPVTFPVKYDDLSTSKNFPGKEIGTEQISQSPLDAMRGKTSEVIYEEDIYVGYRYFESFAVPASFPFGFGLSYTHFEYSSLAIKETAPDQYTVSCKIKNTGEVSGKEVVQLYISAPQSSIEKPTRELKAFTKTKMLKPGEEQEVQFILSPADLASFYTSRSAWIADKGVYLVQINPSVNQTGVYGNLELKNEVVVENAHKAMAPNREIKMFSHKK